MVPVSALTFDPVAAGSQSGSDLSMLNEYGITIKKLPDAPQSQTTISSSTGKNANPVVNAAVGKMQTAGMEVTGTQTGRYEISIPDESLAKIQSDSAAMAASGDGGLTANLATDYAGQIEQFKQLASSTKDNARHENGQTISQIDITSVTFTNTATHESRDTVITQNIDSAGNPTGPVQILSNPESFRSSGSPALTADTTGDQKNLQHKYYWSCVGLKFGFWFLAVFLALVVLAAIIALVICTHILAVSIMMPLVTPGGALVGTICLIGNMEIMLSTIVSIMSAATVIGLGAIAGEATGVPALFNSMKETCAQKESYFTDIPEPLRAHWNLLDNHRTIAWQSYSSTATSYASVQPLPSGGSIATGFLKEGNTMKGIVTTFDSAGAITGSVSLGQDKITSLNNARVSADGTVYIFGATSSKAGPGITEWNGTDAAALVVKMDKDNTILWSRTIGETGSKNGFVAGTFGSDGTIYAAGSRTSGSLTEGYVVALNPDGTDHQVPAWDNTSSHAFRALPGVISSELHAIQVTRDNGFVLAGNAIPPAQSETKGWILKLRPDGSTAWSSLTETGNTGFSGVLEKNGGGYVTVGSEIEPRWDGYLFADDRTKMGGEGVLYAWDAGGAETSYTQFDNLMETGISSIHPASDGGYIVAGLGHINGGPVAGAHGGYDAWVAKLRPDASIAWQKTLGGSKNDEVYDAVELPNGDVIASGYTKSVNYDLNGRSTSLEGTASGWIIDLRYDAGKVPDTMDIRLNE